MRVLLVINATLDPAREREIAAGAYPRKDYLELRAALDADILDLAALDGQRWTRLTRRLAGPVLAQALLAWSRSGRYDAVFADQETTGFALAALYRLWPGTGSRRDAAGRARRPRLTMIGHLLSPRGKQLLLRGLRLRETIDCVVVHASLQRRLAERTLGLAPAQVALVPYQTDERFWSPEAPAASTGLGEVGGGDGRAAGRSVAPDAPDDGEGRQDAGGPGETTLGVGEGVRGQICSAGLEYRDYQTMVAATDGLPVEVVIAAASQWSTHGGDGIAGDRPLPPNVRVAQFDYAGLRALYAASLFVVVPLHDVENQAGITTILEAMAMGKAVVASHSRGQVDVIRDRRGHDRAVPERPSQPDWALRLGATDETARGHTGIYVPPGDPAELRRAVVYLLEHPEVAREMGAAGRRVVAEVMSLDLFTRRLAAIITGAGASSDATSTASPDGSSYGRTMGGRMCDPRRGAAGRADRVDCADCADRMSPARSGVAALLALVVLLTALSPVRTTGAAIVARQRVADGGTTAVYAPDDPLLYGPAPNRFGRPRTVDVYRDGRLAVGWRDVSSAALALAAAPPAGWRGRVLRVALAPGGRIELRAPASIDARGGGYLTIALNGGEAGGQRFSVALTYDGRRLARQIPSSIALPHGATRRQWTTVRVPVQNLVPPGARVDGVLLREDVGLRQPPLYIGAIALQAIPLARASDDAVALSARVDASAGRHAISSYIYGLAGTYGPAYARALRPTLIRWGGNQTTRYNWRIGHAWNAARDYFYLNTDFGFHTGSVADATAAAANAAGATMLFTIPTLGWVARDTRAFSFPDRHGRPGDGGGALCTNPFVKADPRRTSVRVGPADMQAWVRHLLVDKRFDVRFFAMDNEPDLWGVTHYDLHPTCTGYDEIYREFTTYASAVKAVAPRAQVTGPVSCCWQFYYHSMLGDTDRARHDGLGFLPWFLREVRRYDRARGRRTLDVLDLHYYPADLYNSDGDAVTAAWRLQETRSLWDPAYVDHSYINEPVRLIPRMDDLISYWYPGTRLGVSEWNWGDEGRMDGALAVADVLGIYGRQGLYLASYWAYPPVGSPAALAFQLYRNYDGRGAAFGETSVSAVSSNQSRLAIYASLRRSDGHLLMVLANKMPATWADTSLNLRGFAPRAVRVYRYNAANPRAIVPAGSLVIRSDAARLRVPPYTLLLLDASR